MLLKCFILLTLSFNLYAWEIRQEKDEFKLYSDHKAYSLTFNLNAKLINVIEKEDYTLIEYNAGKTGTQEIVEVLRRIVINKKGEVIVDRPYEYRSDNSSITQPVWKFIEKPKSIEIQDSEEDFFHIFSY